MPQHYGKKKTKAVRITNKNKGASKRGSKKTKTAKRKKK